MVLFYVGFVLIVICNIFYLYDCIRHTSAPAIPEELIDKAHKVDISDDVMSNEERDTITEDLKTIEDLKAGKLT